MKINTRTVLFLALCCMIIPIGLSVGREPRQYPVLGTDMITDLLAIEDHKDLLAHWQEIGVKDHLLVNIDAHDDLREFPSDKLDELRQRVLHPGGRSATVSKREGNGSALSNENFIKAAVKLGIVKKVIWVVPDSYDLFSDAGGRLAALLRKNGFPESDISSFRRKSNSFKGSSGGVQIMVCDIDRLPGLDEPILLSIDLDFFPAMISENGQSVTVALKKTFNALYRKKYKVRDVAVAYSVNGGFTGIHFRWVGNLVIDSMRIPGMLTQERLPGRYLYYQSVEQLMRSKRYKELLYEVATFQLKGGNDPNLCLYAAKASQSVGEMEKAFQYAEKACLTERSYCFGLPELGINMLEKGDIAAAERYFQRGYELNPKMELGQFRLAMALKKEGRLDDAIRYFRIFRNSYGPFPIDFYIGEAFQLKGDIFSALNYYNSARNEIIRNPSLLDRFGDYSVLEKCALFYEQQGFTKYDKLLRDRVIRRAVRGG